MKKIKKIVIVLLIVFCVTSCTTYKAYATGAEGIVEIVGGSIAAGGIGATLAVVAPPALIILGVVLIAQGIDVALTEASQAEGMTKTEFIEAKFKDFCDRCSIGFDKACENITNQCRVLADGTIILAEQASDQISKFINMLLAGDMILPPVSTGNYIDLAGINVPIISAGQSISFLYQGGQDIGVKNYNYFGEDIAIFATATSDTNYIIFLKTGSADFRTAYIFNGIEQPIRVVSGFGLNNYQYLYRYPYTYTEGVDSVYVPFVPWDDWQDSVDEMTGGFDSFEGALENDTFVTDDLSQIDTSILNPSSGDVVAVEPGLFIPGLENGRSGTVSVQDYINVLGQALNGEASISVPVADAYTGVITDVSVGAYDLAEDASITQVADDDLVATPLLDVASQPTGDQAEQAINGLAFDLTKIFPFCLPFDIVNLIKKFDVAPVTPKGSLHFPLPGLDETFDIDYDLTPFEGVASVARKMEVVAFIIGLAVITRNLIRG